MIADCSYRYKYMTFEIKFVQELVRCLIYRDNGNDWNLNVVHFNQPLKKNRITWRNYNDSNDCNSAAYYTWLKL